MKKILLLLALCATTVAPAQTAKQRNQTVFDLQQKYDLWPSDSKLMVQSIFDLATAKKAYPACFTAWEREKMAGGMTVAQADTWIMGMTLGEAAYFDALWTNATYSANSGIGRGLCLSRNTIIWPVGTYYTRDQLDYGYNIVEGTSSSSNYEPTGTGGTVIKLWNDQWRGNDTDRVVFGAFHGGTEGSNSYSESVQFRNMRIDGGAGTWKNSKYTITGLRAWDFGSCSDVNNVHINNCDIGLDIVRGTPFNASGNNAIFECNVAAVAITGAAGGTITFSGTLESDDCPALFLIRSGWGRPAGAMLNVQSVKVEWAITGARTWKPEAIVDGEGWMDLNFGSIHYACGNVFLDALFNLTPNVNTSFLHVGDLQVFQGPNVQTLVHDAAAKKSWMYDSGWGSHVKTFDWYSDGTTAQFTSWPAQAVVIDAPYQDRLGYLPGDTKTGLAVGAFDRVKGLPTWSDVTGTSQAPVTPAPVPTPPPTPVPVTVPTGAMLSNARATTSTPVNWEGVTQIIIKGLKWSGTPSYQAIIGNAQGAIRVYPNGSVVDSRTNKVIAPKGTVVAGKSVDVTLAIDPMDVTYMGATPGTGNAWQGTMENLTIK